MNNAALWLPPPPPDEQQGAQRCRCNPTAYTHNSPKRWRPPILNVSLDKLLLLQFLMKIQILWLLLLKYAPPKPQQSSPPPTN
jgi:hypothetical protein